MAGISGYDIASYGDMIECEPRMSVYAEALRRAVTPGCTVFDIGAGFGVFVFLACKYGAGSVVAIEPDPSAELIMPMAQANGFGDKITVIRDLSTAFTPDAKADVIISDIRGTMPLFENHIETIVDARTRLLKPNGAQLPLRDTVRLALVRSPKDYRLCMRPWGKNNYGLDLSMGREYAVNSLKRTHLTKRAMMSEATDLVVLDYRTITSPHLDSTLELIATKTGIAHGMLKWFDAEIAEGLGYSNGPGHRELVYGQNFLPFPIPVRVREGDIIRARIRGLYKDGDYIWSWNTEVIDGASGETRHSFKQSTFKGHVHAPKDLEPFSRDHVPFADPMIAVDRDCLNLASEGRSVAQIVDALMVNHAAQFTTEREALDRVTRLLRRYRNESG